MGNGTVCSGNCVRLQMLQGVMSVIFIDINECDVSPCSDTADCANTVGGYNCTCHSGYSGNGSYCTGIHGLS